MHLVVYPHYCFRSHPLNKLLIASVCDMETGVDVISDCLLRNEATSATIENAIHAFCADVKQNRPIPKERLNILDKKEEIYELKPGKVRLVFFYDKAITRERIVFDLMPVFILHFLKKTQKTPSGIIENAKKLKRKYMEMKAKGSIHIVECQERDDDEERV